MAGSSSGAPLPERVLSGRYLVQEVLGGGGLGVVHQAVDEWLERELAVKIVAGLATGAARPFAWLLLPEAKKALREKPGGGTGGASGDHSARAATFA